MKRFLISGLVLLSVAVLSFGDTATVSLTVTNAQAATLSDAVLISGEIDKIEFSQDSAATSTVTLASYAGSTAVETFASLTTWTDTTKLVIPRRVGTTSAGVSLTAAVFGTQFGTGTNALGTVLYAPYEKPIAGGTIKMSVTGTSNDGANTVTATIYYRRLEK